MLLKVLDGLGIAQTVLAAGQESQADRSGTIVATGVAQTLLLANAFRSGWFIQNRGSNQMLVNEIAAAASAIGANNGSFAIPAGGTFPPPGFPVSIGAISIMGTISDGFTVREW